jgi:hypothetical protein
MVDQMGPAPLHQSKGKAMGREHDLLADANHDVAG